MPAPQDKEWFSKEDWLKTHDQLLKDSAAAGDKCQLVFIGPPHRGVMSNDQCRPTPDVPSMSAQAIQSRRAGVGRVRQSGRSGTQSTTR